MKPQVHNDGRQREMDGHDWRDIALSSRGAGGKASLQLCRLMSWNIGDKVMLGEILRARTPVLRKTSYLQSEGTS